MREKKHMFHFLFKNPGMLPSPVPCFFLPDRTHSEFIYLCFFSFVIRPACRAWALGLSLYYYHCLVVEGSLTMMLPFRAEGIARGGAMSFAYPLGWNTEVLFKMVTLVQGAYGAFSGILVMMSLLITCRCNFCWNSKSGGGHIAYGLVQLLRHWLLCPCCS